MWTPLLSVIAIGWLASRLHIPNRVTLIAAGQDIAIACTVGMAVDSWLLLHQMGQSTMLSWFGYYWLLVGATLIGGRIMIRVVMMSFGWWQRRTLIIADPIGTNQLRRLLQYNRHFACSVRTELIIDDAGEVTLNRLEHMLNADDVQHAILDIRSSGPDVLVEALMLLDRYSVTYDLALQTGGTRRARARVQAGIGSDVAVLPGCTPNC